MKFNLRFITTLILIVLIIISFVFIILETLYFSNTKKLVIEDIPTAGATAKEIDTLTAAVGTTVKIKTPGTTADKLVSETQYYRYGSLLIHVLAMISGAYIVYSG